MNSQRKRCAHCHRWLLILTGTTFSRHRSKPDGLQPFCRQCDRCGEVEVTRAYGRLRAALLRTGSPEFRWGKDVYYQKLLAAGFRCTYCNTLVHEWSRGYWLDRQSAGDERYLPESTVVCCWPCNRLRGRRNIFEWMRMIEYYRSVFRGVDIPWDQVDPIFRRCKTPDLSQYVCDPQLGLPL